MYPKYSLLTLSMTGSKSILPLSLTKLTALCFAVISSEQEEIFAETAYPVCENVIQGYNGTIFAYGQTGTGKTFTITGVPDDPVNKGIMPRAFENIFQ